jgi:hypothetical protein
MGDEDKAFNFADSFVDSIDTIGQKFHIGEKAVADGDTVTHGLSATPDQILLTSSVAGVIPSFSSAGASTFQVDITYMKWGKEADCINGSAFAHGLGEVPGAVLLTASVAGYIVDADWGNIDATNIQIFLHADDGTPVASGGASDVSWIALLNPTNTKDIQWQVIGDE